MIGALREGAKSGIIKFILFSFLVLAVAGLVLMDVGGFFRNGPHQGAIAEVNGQDISTRHFDQTVRRILSQQGMDIQTAYQLGFINQILQSEISNALLRQAAYDEGLRVSNDLVARQVSKLVAPFVNDQLSAPEALRRILMSQNMSEAEFSHGIRVEMSNALLRNALSGGTDYLPQETIDDLYRYMYESRKLSFVVFPDSAIKDYQKPTDDVLLPFYQAGKERYALPESRVFTLAILSSDRLKDSLDISEDDLKAAYENDIALYTQAEQRLLEQSVVAAKGDADAIAQAVQNGATLKEAVKEATGRETAYLGADDFTQDGLPTELAGAVFAAAEGDVVGPIETALGWHVLVVKTIEAPDITPFDEVKAQIKEDLKHDMLADELFAMSGNMDDRLASGMSLEDVAEEMGLTLRKIKPLRADGTTPDGKPGLADFERDKTYILETAFELLPGETSPVMEMADGSYAAIRLDELNEKSYTPFDEVKDQLSKLWIADQQQVLNKLKAQEALQAVFAGEKTLKDFGKVKSVTVTRAAAAPDSLGDQAKGVFFEAGQDAPLMAQTKDGLVIGQVDKIALPAVDKAKAEDLAQVSAGLRQQSQGEIFLSYLQALHEKYDVKINRHLLDTLYAPGSE